MAQYREVGSMVCSPVLFLAAIPCDALSAFLAFCGRVAYPAYALGLQSLKHNALADQELAGATMWAWVTFAYLIPALVITMQILSFGDTRAQGVARATRPPPSAGSLNGGETVSPQ